jgi:hypothetical protein
MEPPPTRQTGGDGGTLRRSGSLLLTSNYHQNAPPPQAPLNLIALRTLWWSHWRRGIRLPAELGIILIDGGKR